MADCMCTLARVTSVIMVNEIMSNLLVDQDHELEFDSALEGHGVEVDEIAITDLHVFLLAGECDQAFEAYHEHIFDEVVAEDGEGRRRMAIHVGGEVQLVEPDPNVWTLLEHLVQITAADDLEVPAVFDHVEGLSEGQLVAHLGLLLVIG